MDKVNKERELTIGERVLVRKFRGQPKWFDGSVKEQTYRVSYNSRWRIFGPVFNSFSNSIVLVGDQLWKHHVDQMRQTRIERLDRRAGVSKTFPRSSDQ